MAQQSRTVKTGLYHVQYADADGKLLCLLPRDYRFFLDILRCAITRHNASLIAYSATPREWQLLIGPIGKQRLAALLDWVAATHRGRSDKQAEASGKFSITRLDDAAAVVPMCRYVERNARSAGLVDHAEAWPWNSLSQRLTNQDHVPLIAAPFLKSSSWRGYVNAAITQNERTRDLAAARVRMLKMSLQARAAARSA